jgi:hypothetical protein
MITTTTTTTIITTIIMTVVIIIIVIMIVSPIINNSDGDFDLYFLNCYFLKSFCMINSFFWFHHLIFNFLEFGLRDFSKLGVSSWKTRITGLKS